MHHLDMFLITDSALDQADINTGWVLFDIEDGTEYKVHLLGKLEQKLVEIQKGHVAAGTAAEPHGS